MSKESMNDFNLYNNVYNVLQSSEYKSELSDSLMAYYKNFLDRYSNSVNDETEYLANDATYKEFRDTFLVIYRSYGSLSNAKYSIPLFIYLYDSNYLTFSLNKFESFVNVAESMEFSDLLGFYDIYEPGMNVPDFGKGRGTAI